MAQLGAFSLYPVLLCSPIAAVSNRIDSLFGALRDSQQKAFVAYICAGDPNMAKTKDIVHALVAAGVDLLELGVPFSDPLADGIVNQMAAQRALEAGATTQKVIELIAALRHEGVSIPIILFTYLNPIYTYGFESFHKAAAAAGADGILVLDMPPEEADSREELRYHEGLKQIRLIAPTSPPERIAAIAAKSEGFIYYVSREGVTGERGDVADSIGDQVALIKRHTDTPVAVGFGISSPEQARSVASLADGVVVGSAIVKVIAKEGGAPDLAEKVRAFVKPLVDAVKSA